MDDYTREFIEGYKECSLWSSSYNHPKDNCDTPMDRDFGLDDFSADAEQRIFDDCQQFISENITLLLRCDYKNGECTNAALAGHDFWLTRNGHGTGFWDRGLGEIGKKLTDAAHGFGECYLFVGSNEQVEIE